MSRPVPPGASTTSAAVPLQVDSPNRSFLDIPPTGRRSRIVAATVAAILCLLTLFIPAGAELDDGVVFINQEHNLVDDMAWGDMDADGDLDVAVGAYDWTLGRFGLVYENASPKPFVLKWAVYQGDDLILGYPSWGDFDGDGDLDLSFGHTVFANTANGFVDVFIAPLDEYELRKKASWADYDGDGDLDFALGGTVYPNDNGSLSTDGVVIGVGEVSDWGDMDDDGDLDMALVGDEHEDVQIYRQEATGSYSLVLQARLVEHRSDGDYDANPADLDWGDMDRDADLDLAVSTQEARTSFLLRNTSAGFEIEQLDNPHGASSVAWGDWNNDGYPDLAYGTCPDELINCNDFGGGVRPAEVYENRPGQNGERVLSQPSQWTSGEIDAEYVAWTDWDSDGDLDLSTAFDTDSELIYINEDNGIWAEAYTPVAANNGAWGNFDTDPALEFVTDGELATADKAQVWELVDGQLEAWPTALNATGWGVATGDFDGDNDLDIAVGGDVFRYHNGSFSLYWSATANDSDLWNPVWVDWDSDGQLELTLQDATQVYLYQYTPQQGQFEMLWESPELIAVYDTAWGDLDGDSLLDLAIARGWDWASYGSLPSQVYRNIGSDLIRVWEAPGPRDTMTLAWGDWDGDGDSDLALGNDNERNQVYANNAGQLELVWESADFYTTHDIAWLDHDSDGDVDLAAANEWNDVVLYENDGNTLGQPISLDFGEAQSLSVGDADADGDLDIIAIEGDQYDGHIWALFIENRRQDRQAQSPYHTAVTIRAPAVVANYYGVGRILEQTSIPIDYTLYNNNSDTVGRAELFYSLNGGGQWLPAKNSAGATSQTHLAASPTGVEHTFSWDTRQSGLFGLYDNVVFRVDVYTHADDPAPAGTYQYANVTMRTFQRPAKVSAQTTPFRVRGSQVLVVDEADDPVAGATVFRLKDGETLARPIGNGQGHIFTTDATGYLQGHGELNPGDRLFALWPAPAEEQPPEGYPYTVYYTSGAAGNDGPAMTDVSAFGTQELTVSPDNVLILFDLVVSLEWDARRDTTFMTQLQNDIRRASEIVYDLTDGQAALGQVHIYHDKGHWGVANVVIPAGNHIRPAATLGGIVPEPQPDTDKNGTTLQQVYVPGQVRIGPTWNRFGDAEGTLGEDWPRTLAHELGHYLFYLPDNYLGIQNGALTLVDCAGSAMTDPYRADYSEFLPRARWTGACLNTVAETYLGRADWQTIDRPDFYPALTTPAAVMNGPSALPLQVTQITSFAPDGASPALAAPIFNVADAGGSTLAIPQGRGQAYLVKHQRGAAANDDTARYVVELGSPIGPLLNARGAAPGDELCVFDYSVSLADTRLGCVTVGQNPGTIRLTTASNWRPMVTVTGRMNDEKTVDVVVSGAAGESALKAQLLPTLGDASAEVPMTRDGQNWRATLTAADGAFYGHVRVWVPGSSPAARQTFAPYTNLEAWQGNDWGGYAYAWGNPPSAWGGYAYAWGGYAYAWGGYAYAWGAPVMSGDGQVSFLPQASLFGQSELLSLQSQPAPNLDSWLTQVGQAYRLRALDGSVPAGSIIFRYLARDVPDGMEDHLTVYFQAEGQTTWQRLNSTRQAEYNHVAAPVQGPGTYALVATVQLTTFAAGWNTFAYPIAGSQPVGAALASLGDKYTSVYHFDSVSNAWKLYDRAVGAEYGGRVNTLTELSYGQTYWLYATQPVTLYLAAPTTNNPPPVPPNRHFPPATYYGTVTPGTGFAPAAGDTLTATIGSATCGQTTLATQGASLVYVVQVQAETLVGPADGCGRDGRPITFTVRGVALSGPTAALWDNTQAHLHPLTGSGTPPAPQISDFNPKSGPVGTAVTLTGTNLSNATAVTFNGVAASIVSNTATQVQTTVPSGATDGLIRLTVGGQVVTTATPFDVTEPPVGIPDVYYLSIAGTGSYTLGNLSGVKQSDIVRYTRSTGTWQMVYNGTSRGTTKNISAFALLSDGSWLLVFAANQSISGVTYTPWDVVKFTPNNPNQFPLGAGTYSMWLDGSAVGLTTTAEKIDSLDASGNGQTLYIGTSGAATVPRSGTTLKTQDEDVLAFTRTGETAGTWGSPARLDGTTIGNLKSSDVNAYWEDGAGNRYLTVVTNTPVNLGNGVSAGPNAIVKLTPNGSGGWVPSLVPWLASGSFGRTLDGLEIGP